MALFIILAGLLTLLAAALLLRPLLRRMDAPASPAAHGQAVYRDQLHELERDVARGLLSPEEEVAARAEIGRRLLAAGRTAQAAPAAGAGPQRVLAVIVCLLPVAAVALYVTLGRPGAPDRPLAPRLAAGETRTQSCDTAMEGAIAQLSEALRSQPNDFENRAMLARAQMRCGAYDAASENYQTAIALTEGGDNSGLLAEYGQARMMAADGFIDAEAFDAFRQALEANPRSVEARLYLGLAMAEYDQPDAARTLWESLLADSPADAPWVGAVRARLSTLPPRGAARPAPAAPDATPNPGPDTDTGAGAGDAPQ